MVKAIMHGCNGHMGRVITDIIKNTEGIELVAGVDKYTKVPNDYPVFESIDACDVEADVIIDFSNAAAADELLDYCVEKQVPVVLCTTGLSEEQLEKVEESAKKVAVLKSANMSLGINLLMKILKDATKVLSPAGYDIELVEKHHNQKLDAPSGTALALADSINEAADNQYHYVYDRSQVRQKRDQKEIGISAVRGGTIVGDHEVIFATCEIFPDASFIPTILSTSFTSFAAVAGSILHPVLLATLYIMIGAVTSFATALKCPISPF